MMKKMTLEERAYEVLFNDGDDSLLTEGEVYEIYDTVMELVEQRKTEGVKPVAQDSVTWH